MGSPPHMRGKVLFARQKLRLYGITPAYAGKSSFCRERKSANLGSPPHMRGKVTSTEKYVSFPVDHPRICGEKFLRRHEHDVLRGSPPHMRGKVRRQYEKDGAGRITPAYAGKRNCGCKFVHCGKDHPRICGEKGMVTLLLGNGLGSPPHMRGKVMVAPVFSAILGITPAYAGKSREINQQEEIDRDHPRICGEKRKYFVCVEGN